MSREQEQNQEQARPLTMDSRFGELLANPVGRDVIDKVLLFSGLSPKLLKPFARWRLRTLDRLIRPLSGPGLVEVVLRLANGESEVPPTQGPHEDPWWRGAVFYQVYPRSFADSNGDGIGDLRGILEHLDQLWGLGVDCLWLSPIFDSPNHDQGYDIRDFRAVLAEMGTLADLDELIAACHRRGMRIILDLVVNHTSTEHPWFRTAVADPASPEHGYYFFVDGTPERPPNNWRSFFSGSAWLRAGGQWVLHLFDSSQVDLNWDNPAVRAEVAGIVRWWLDRGVDGFRMDVINYISKAPGLPDGHPFVRRLLEFTGIEHYFYGPRLHEFLRELRKTAFTRPDGSVAVMIGETPGIGIETGRMLSAHGREELDLVFNFDGLDTPGHTRWDDYRYDLNHLADFWCELQHRNSPADWAALFCENHDNPRMVSKVLGAQDHDPVLRTRVAKVIATLQLTMRGTVFLYQGQELGAINEPFTGPADLRDVESMNRLAELRAQGRSARSAWAEVMAGSRDHARTPIRWDDHDAEAGAEVEWWLPGRERTPGFSVAEQQLDPESVLSWYRRLIALRREFGALSVGKWELVHRSGDLFSWRRWDEESSWLVELNLAARSRRRVLPRSLRSSAPPPPTLTTAERLAEGILDGWSAVLTRLPAPGAPPGGSSPRPRE